MRARFPPFAAFSHARAALVWRWVLGKRFVVIKLRCPRAHVLCVAFLGSRQCAAQGLAGVSFASGAWPASAFF